MLDGSFTFLTIDQNLLLLKHVIYSYLKIMLQKTILIIFLSIYILLAKQTSLQKMENSTKMLLNGLS